MTTTENTLTLTPNLKTQNVTPNRITRQERIDQLIDYLFNGHLTFTRAAQKIGVTRRQAYRYFNEWKQTNEAQQIDSEWWSLYLKLREENPEKALECLTRLKYRMTTEKHELNIKKVSVSKQVQEIIKFSREQHANPTGTSGDIQL